MTNPPRTSDEIRDAFVRFFQERGHQVLPPWPLVPIGDPTSLFTTAGMQQFKPIFMSEQPSRGPRAPSLQPVFCRVDFEEVVDLGPCTGVDMLGNFSFGYYFKGDAIQFAWDLLTGVYQVPPERLHVTVYLEDD